MTQSNQQQPDQGDSTDNWLPCEDGTITGHSKKTVTMNRRQMLLGGGAVVLLASGVIIRSAILAGVEPPTFAMTCSEVQPQLPAYVANQIRDRQLYRSIAVHLGDCKRCTSTHDQLV